MSITTEGIEAERKARDWLRKHKIYNLQQIDWLFKYKNKYYIVEVKIKELFQPPPFLGTGLDIKQLELRKQLYNDLNIDTLLLVFDKNINKIYYNYLSKLEQTEYFDTKNGIRIYKIDNFKTEDQL